jgi:hypothetical protein
MFATSYPSLDAFYAADSRRRHSRERDLGLLWRDRGNAAFRAAWVEGTGEVYLFMYERVDGSGGSVEVLDRRFGPQQLLRTFAGYRDICGRNGSLLWLLDRAEGPRSLPMAA